MIVYLFNLDIRLYEPTRKVYINTLSRISVLPLIASNDSPVSHAAIPITIKIIFKVIFFLNFERWFCFVVGRNKRGNKNKTK